MAACAHLQDLSDAAAPAYDDGCPTCVAAGDTWVHLRYCDVCGAAGCCDSSPNKHATAHARASGHLVIRPLEPEESWAWCVEHEVGARV